MNKKSTLLHKTEKLVSKFEDVLVKIGTIFLFIMMGLVVVDVLGRSLFNNPLTGNVELIEFFMVLSVYVGMSYTHREKAHVGMDIFVENVLKGTALKISNIAILFLSFLANLAISVFTLNQSMTLYKINEVSIYLNLPLWPLPLFVSLGSFMLCIRLLFELLKAGSVKPSTGKK